MIPLSNQTAWPAPKPNYSTSNTSENLKEFISTTIRNSTTTTNDKIEEFSKSILQKLENFDTKIKHIETKIREEKLTMIKFINDIFNILPKTKNFDYNTYKAKLTHYFNLSIDSSKKIIPNPSVQSKAISPDVNMFDPFNE